MRSTVNTHQLAFILFHLLLGEHVRKMETDGPVRVTGRRRKNPFAENEAVEVPESHVVDSQTSTPTQLAATPTNPPRAPKKRPAPLFSLKDNADDEADLLCTICGGEVEVKISKSGNPYFICSMQFSGNLHGKLPYLGPDNVNLTLQKIEEGVHDDFKPIKGGAWPVCVHAEFAKLVFITDGGKNFKDQLLFKCDQSLEFTGTPPCGFEIFANQPETSAEQDILSAQLEEAKTNIKELIAKTAKEAKKKQAVINRTKLAAAAKE